MTIWEVHGTLERDRLGLVAESTADHRGSGKRAIGTSAVARQEAERCSQRRRTRTSMDEAGRRCGIARPAAT
jgi:hypothetical protein